jgi:hypothetical protein
LNYIQNNDWQINALRIAAELFLLIEAFKNSEKLSPEWQLTIKNLVGWNQSQKELLQNPDAEKVKDVWIALGQEQEESEGITIQRNWLWGTKTNRSALILNFGTPFSPLENTVIPGTILEAELAFFPSVTPHRAVVNLQKGYQETFLTQPHSANTWNTAYQQRTEQIAKYPFVYDIPMIINDLRLVLDKKQSILCDTEGYFQVTSPTWKEDKMLTLYALAGANPQTIAGVFRRDGFLPLGIFQGDTYLML